MLKVAVLISGNGSNLQAVIDAVDQQNLAIDLHLVVSNNPEAHGLTRAQQANIPTAILNHRLFTTREAYDAALIQLLKAHHVELVVLAGFMRILTPHFVDAFPQRILNIHPSLLPKFRGLNTHQRVLDAGESQHGCTVHYVSHELDAGEIIDSAQCAIEPHDTPESLQAKVHHLEHQLYPKVIAEVAGKLQRAS